MNIEYQSKVEVNDMAKAYRPGECIVRYCFARLVGDGNITNEWSVVVSRAHKCNTLNIGIGWVRIKRLKGFWGR